MVLEAGNYKVLKAEKLKLEKRQARIGTEYNQNQLVLKLIDNELMVDETLDKHLSEDNEDLEEEKEIEKMEKEAEAESKEEIEKETEEDLEDD